MTTLTTEIEHADARWTAVLSRDRGGDGRFVYAVRTTGVYCRPSCPSRRPRPEHVAFFDAPDVAEAAGYRACRRCTPRASTTDAERAVARVRAHLDAHADSLGAPLALADLARVAGTSLHHLQRTFTRLVGVSPRAYLAALRADRLKAELRRGSTVSRATFEAGYAASSRAYAAAGEQLGMTPAAYRHGGRGVAVRYTVAPVDIGGRTSFVLVAATARGVCAVTLGDAADALAADLAAEYPNAERTHASTADLDDADPLGVWTAAVVDYLRGMPGAASAALAGVPADAPGTAFQERVWAALRAIPAGETRTYGEVAAAVGAPRAVRAVARACATNRVALVVPCHRVVRDGGALAGYRWGVERKRALLAHERGAGDGE